MEEKQTNLNTKTISARELLAEIRQIPIFQLTKEQDLECLGEVELVEAPAGAVLFDRGETRLSFWVVLQGEVRLVKPELDNGITLLGSL
jgi:CRP-like cAMP-binding protein